MNWQRYTDRMNTWRALNPGASPDEYEAASLAIERDVANQSSRHLKSSVPFLEIGELPVLSKPNRAI